MFRRNRSSATTDQAPVGRRRGFHLSKAFDTLLVALIPVMLAVGAGFYSAVRQCNQDASDLETQLTSTLLEVSGREARMQSLLDAGNNVSAASLRTELTQIESGAEGRYGDPLFKDHSLVSLVNQYNRLLRRVQFPAGLKCDAATCCDTIQKCNAKLECAQKGQCDATILDIDTQRTHAQIETLNLTGADPRSFAGTINGDLTEVTRQQTWHKLYGPVRLCQPWTLAFGSEPWHLMSLVSRGK